MTPHRPISRFWLVLGMVLRLLLPIGMQTEAEFGIPRKLPPRFQPLVALELSGARYGILSACLQSPLCCSWHFPTVIVISHMPQINLSLPLL